MLRSVNPLQCRGHGAIQPDGDRERERLANAGEPFHVCATRDTGTPLSKRF
jgi:hypothetical protein